MGPDEAIAEEDMDADVVLDTDDDDGVEVDADAEAPGTTTCIACGSVMNDHFIYFLLLLVFARGHKDHANLIWYNA